MAKYHVNPETGEVGECSATRRCPFGDLQKDHYASPQEARKAYEAQNDGATVAPAVRKRKDEVPPVPDEVREWKEVTAAASSLSKRHQVELRGSFVPVLSVKVGYKYAAVTVPDSKKGERVVNFPKDETVSAKVAVETQASSEARMRAHSNRWVADALTNHVSARAGVVNQINDRISRGYDLGASVLNDLARAEARDKIVEDLRRRTEWVKANEPDEQYKYDRAAALLAEDYKAEVLTRATSSHTSSNAAYTLYDMAETSAKASFIRDGVWHLNVQ